MCFLSILCLLHYTFEKLQQRKKYQSIRHIPTFRKYLSGLKNLLREKSLILHFQVVINIQSPDNRITGSSHRVSAIPDKGSRKKVEQMVCVMLCVVEDSCPACNNTPHDTNHLFNCSSTPTHLEPSTPSNLPNSSSFSLMLKKWMLTRAKRTNEH